MLTHAGFALGGRVFHLTADVGGVAVKGKCFDGAEGVGLAGIANHIEQEIEGRRLAGGAERAEEDLAEIGVALAGEGLFQQRGGAGEAGRTERECGLLGYGSKLGLEELGHEGQGLAGFELEEVVECLADDFGFGIALARFQAKEQDGFVALHLGDSADGVGTDGEGAVSQSVDQVAQDLAARNIGARRQREGTGAAERGGGVGFPAPHGLHLNVMDATREGSGFAMVEGDEGLGDGVFAPTLRVAFDGLLEEAIEGAEEIGEEVGDAQFDGHFGGFGDDEVDAVRKGFF